MASHSTSLAFEKRAWTMKYGVLLVTAMLACTGCTTLALKRHALKQEATSTDIRYQEILDNLAMVAHDPAALPAYASIFTGTAQVTDTAQLGSTTTWSPGAAAQALAPQFTRAELGNWTLDPINAPEKLEAIRGACRWVVYGPRFAYCHDCGGLLASPEQWPWPGRHFGVADRLAQLPRGWLHVSPSCGVSPAARYKSHCGDTWVWVMPGETECLANFCLILQDIARVDINSPTLQCIRPAPSDFVFPTPGPQRTPCCEGPYARTVPFVLAEVSIDPCGTLQPDTPYYRARVENVGSDAALRSQINAAGLH
jgi:hypothetical protein